MHKNPDWVQYMNSGSNMCIKLEISMECYCLDNFWKIFGGKQATLHFLPFVMASNSKEKRKRVIHLMNRIMGTRADWKKFTADHFIAEGIPKSTIYDIIKMYLA